MPPKLTEKYEGLFGEQNIQDGQLYRVGSNGNLTLVAMS